MTRRASLLFKLRDTKKEEASPLQREARLHLPPHDRDGIHVQGHAEPGPEAEPPLERVLPGTLDNPQNVSGNASGIPLNPPREDGPALHGGIWLEQGHLGIRQLRRGEIPKQSSEGVRPVSLSVEGDDRGDLRSRGVGRAQSQDEVQEGG